MLPTLEFETKIVSFAGILLQIYPLFLWTGKNYCVLGRRILHIISPHVYGKDKIRVVYLPSASEDEGKILMNVIP